LAGELCFNSVVGVEADVQVRIRHLEEPMTRYLSVSFIALFGLAAVTTSYAQTAQYDLRTLPYDHVHLSVPDPEKAAAWYATNLNGVQIEGTTQVKFADTLLAFRKGEGAMASAGSVIDHIGFSFALLDLKLASLESAGAKITTPARNVEGLFRLAFVEDPWGIKIELVGDKDTPGFHHIHLRATDPEEMFKWLGDAFGGERTKLGGQLDGIKHKVADAGEYQEGQLWIFVQKADTAPKPSVGTVIDHLGWRTSNLDQTAADLKAKGVKFTEDPRDAGNLRISFIEGPGGLRVEVLQRP
jgi:lactoylglutathione lyase